MNGPWKSSTAVVLPEALTCTLRVLMRGNLSLEFGSSHDGINPLFKTRPCIFSTEHHLYDD